VPEQQLVMVRFGRGHGGVRWIRVFRSIARALEEQGHAS
jgi:hypothetical protein